MAVLDFLYVPGEWRRIPVVCKSWLNVSRAAKWFRPICRNRKDLEKVIHAPYLQWLELSDPDANMLQRLSVASELRTLSLMSNVHIKAVGLLALATIPKLQSLTIRIWKPLDEGDQTLTALTKLRELNLGDGLFWCVENSDLQALTTLTQLQSLGLFFTSSVDWRAMTHFRELRKLTFGAIGLPDESLRLFCSLPLLEELHLTRCECFTDAGLNALMTTKLRTLILEKCGWMTNEGVRMIASVTTLQTLRLWGCGTSIDADEAVGCLCTLVNLRNFGVDWRSLTDTAVETLLSLPRLQELQLDGRSQLTDSSQHALKLKCVKFGKFEKRFR